MTTHHWDVMIVGAGPAGLALARALEGRRILLIDRHMTTELPASRIGESLPAAAGVLLKKLGVFESFLAGSHRERCATLAVWDDVESVWWDSLRDPAGAGWHLDRLAFDQLLREAARAAGATLLEGCTRFEIERMGAGWSVAFSSSNTQHEAPILIDATGRSRAVARRLGLKSYAQDDLLCMHTFLAMDSAMDEDATTCVCADEYGWWYTVQTPHRQRVLAYHVDAKKSPWRQWRNPVDFLANARRHPLLADRIQALQPASLHYRAAGTSVLDISGLSHTPGFLAIGDAVLAFDPISSQGIFHSLASAESAAKAIRADFHLNRSALNDFQNEMQSVSSRYLYHLKNTYRGPKRFAQYDFWAKRCDALYSSNPVPY